MQIHGFFAIPPAIAEGWTVVCLLVWGVRTSHSQPRVDAAVLGDGSELGRSHGDDW